ncbi:NUDIX domain-containing protein [Sphingobium sp. H39-3-25]|uniref:NUDIX hydrolase n=1 Tax=Sphingobium arseniciresistens TaxID=3030834 RepID=UPI0023B9807D|nr:NUDIX domain-containing protein [Sphingobium arseniciresistens]
MTVPCEQPSTMHLSRDAATLVIFRDRADGPAELLMLERAQTMAFAAGAMVFPGGAVDEGDRHLAASLAAENGLDVDEASARIAAIRETLEESGLATALLPLPDAATTVAMRDALAGGAGFATLLARFGLSLDLAALVPFARWHPNPREAVRHIFDTRFYLFHLTGEQHLPSVDATENVRLFWASASEVLKRHADGEAHLIFPTRCNLERLAQFESFSAAAAHARMIPVEKVTPWIEERDGERHLCIPGHLGYPVTSARMDAIRRG